jgi:dihydrolipoamide dehydrogenase
MRGLMAQTEYDIVVIGGGPGGYVAALRAAQQGANVCLIESDRVGGTCLNRGCIPTKALYSTAQLYHRMQKSAEHGIASGPITFDYAQAVARKDSIVEQLVGGIAQLLKSAGVDVFIGKASLESAKRVRFQNQSMVGYIQAGSIILATGSLPVRPEVLFPSRKNILTSTEILAIKDFPTTLLVIGGGYIGCEFASIFATLGCKVTIVEQLPQLLSTSDRQIVREVEKSFKSQGVTVHTGVAVDSLEPSADSVIANFSDQQETFDKVLVSIGRRPNSSDLNLESVGVVTDKGAIQVDEHMRTSVSNIYAIGDVTGGIQLAHVASYQAGVAVANALGGNESADYRVVPSAIFTYPEVAQVGLTEAECKTEDIQVNVGRFAYLASGKALCEGETQGSVKVVAEKESDRILGVAIVGEGASAMIAEVTVAMAQNMTASQLASVIHAHPTLPEIVFEAVEDVHGLAVHKTGRRRAKK